MSNKREKFSNNASSTLDGSVNSTTTSVTVNDASDFPDDGDFRIIVGNELMKVTSVASNTFTVERGSEGTTANTHNDDDSVYQIITADSVMRKFKNEILYFDEKPLYHSITDESGNTLTVSDFTWLNQGNSVATDVHGTIYLEVEDDGNSNIQGLEIDTPNVAYTATVGVRTCLFQGPASGLEGYPQVLIFIRDSSSGKLTVLASVYRGYTTAFQVANWSSVSNFSSDLNGLNQYTSSEDVWLRIEDDDTDFNFYISSDGVNWASVGSVGRTSFLSSPDKVGIACNSTAMTSNYSPDGFQKATFFHFSVET
jgi:hypothetical protein